MSEEKNKVPDEGYVAAMSALGLMSSDSIAEMKDPVTLEPGGKPFLVLPDKDGRFRIEDVSAFEGPRRSVAVKCDDLPSFVHYVVDFREPSSRIFCNLEAKKFTAFIDFHSAEDKTDARRCQHGAELQLTLSDSAQAWIERDRKAQDQAEFADFLEDRYADMVTPTGADMLEIAKTLEMKPDVHFKSAQRQHDGGYNLIFQESVTAAAGASGNLEVPERIKIRIPLFAGGEPVEMEARLLYRISGGALSFSVRFIRLADILREAVLGARYQIAEETGLPVHCATARPY